MFFSAAGGVLAVILISNPVWGVAAAIGLATSGVGFLAGLLMVQRKSWADKTWPPGGRSRPYDARRSRRTLLIYGCFIVLLSVAGAASLLLVGTDEIERAGHNWVLIGLFAVVGVACVAIGARPVRASVQSESRPRGDNVVDEEGWFRLGADGSASAAGWGTVSYVPILQAPALVFVTLPILSRLPAWIAPVALVALSALIALVAVSLRRRRRSPWVSENGTAIRQGRREVPASEITAAYLSYTPWGDNASERSLAITLTGSGGFRSTVGLRKRGHLVLNDTETALLTAFLEQSAIELPRDKEDPQGRFSKTLYPTHLTRAEALEVVERPPGDGERLPIAVTPLA